MGLLGLGLWGFGALGLWGLRVWVLGLFRAFGFEVLGCRAWGLGFEVLIAKLGEFRKHSLRLRG